MRSFELGRRRASAVLWIVAALVGALLLPTSGGASSTFSFTRLAGQDRYETAAVIATSTFTSSNIVVLGSGEAFPDALSANYLAGVAGVPILLTARDTLPASTAAALQSLGVKDVLLVGGTGAISEAVDNALRARGLSTSRIAGPSRYDTSQKVAESAGPGAVGSIDGPPAAVVASGEGFADALAVGGIAYARRLPVILTGSASLAPQAKGALQNLGIKRVLLPGGTASVSSGVQSEITALGITVTRVAGSDRSETASKLSDFALTNLAFSKSHVELARGDGFADALAIGPRAGKGRAPALLTASSNDIGSATRAWLQQHQATLTDGDIAGGTGAVSTAVQNDATAAGRSGTTTTTAAPTTSSTTSTVPGATTTTLANVPTTLPNGLPTTLPGIPTTTSTSSTTTAPTTTTTPPTLPNPSLPPCTLPETGPGEPFCFPPAGTPPTTIPPSSTTTSAPPGAPQLVPPAVAEDKATSITVTFSQPVTCNTLQGADYTFTVLVGPGAAPQNAQVGPFPFTTAACTSAGTSATSATLTIDFGYFQAGQVGTIDFVGDVRGPGGPEPKGDSEPFTVSGAPTPPAAGSAPTPPPVPPTMVGPASTTPGTEVVVNYGQPVTCSTVKGAEFTYTINAGPGTGTDTPGGPVTTIGPTPFASAVCRAPSGGTSTQVVLVLHDGAFQAGQTGSISMTGGVSGPGGAEPSGDTVPFAVSAPS